MKEKSNAKLQLGKLKIAVELHEKTIKNNFDNLIDFSDYLKLPKRIVYPLLETCRNAKETSDLKEIRDFVSGNMFLQFFCRNNVTMPLQDVADLISNMIENNLLDSKEEFQDFLDSTTEEELEVLELDIKTMLKACLSAFSVVNQFKTQKKMTKRSKEETYYKEKTEEGKELIFFDLPSDDSIKCCPPADLARLNRNRVVEIKVVDSNLGVIATCPLYTKGTAQTLVGNSIIIPYDIENVETLTNKPNIFEVNYKVTVLRGESISLLGKYQFDDIFYYMGKKVIKMKCISVPLNLSTNEGTDKIFSIDLTNKFNSRSFLNYNGCLYLTDHDSKSNFDEIDFKREVSALFDAGIKEGDKVYVTCFDKTVEIGLFDVDYFQQTSDGVDYSLSLNEDYIKKSYMSLFLRLVYISPKDHYYIFKLFVEFLNKEIYKRKLVSSDMFNFHIGTVNMPISQLTEGSKHKTVIPESFSIKLKYFANGIIEVEPDSEKFAQTKAALQSCKNIHTKFTKYSVYDLDVSKYMSKNPDVTEKVIKRIINKRRGVYYKPVILNDRIYLCPKQEYSSEFHLKYKPHSGIFTSDYNGVSLTKVDSVPDVIPMMKDSLKVKGRKIEKPIVADVFYLHPENYAVYASGFKMGTNAIFFDKSHLIKEDLKFFRDAIKNDDYILPYSSGYFISSYNAGGFLVELGSSFLLRTHSSAMGFEPLIIEKYKKTVEVIDALISCKNLVSYPKKSTLIDIGNLKLPKKHINGIISETDSSLEEEEEHDFDQVLDSYNALKKPNLPKYDFSSDSVYSSKNKTAPALPAKAKVEVKIEHKRKKWHVQLD